MLRLRRPAVRPRAVADGALAVLHCSAAFTLEPGHPLRAANCLVCHALIGGRPATVIGVAALAGQACECGGVVSDTFIIHAGHMPLPAVLMANTLRRGIKCPYSHGYP